jgi:hypothetical protein
MPFPDFDIYVEKEHGGWGAAGDCTGCGRPALRLARGDVNQYCEWCLREDFGSHQAEYETAAALAELLAPLERWGV